VENLNHDFASHIAVEHHKAVFTIDNDVAAKCRNDHNTQIQYSQEAALPQDFLRFFYNIRLTNFSKP
jgi:hypothetical protein